MRPSQKMKGKAPVNRAAPMGSDGRIVSIISDNFGIQGNLFVSSIIQTSTLKTNNNLASTIQSCFISSGSIYASTGTINTLYSSKIYSSSIYSSSIYTKYIYASTGFISTVSSSVINTDDIIVDHSTITDTVTFNIPKPFTMFTNYVPKVVFPYSGITQTFTVPDGVTKLFVRLWGACGAGRTILANPNYGVGGNGAFVSGYLNVNPGDILTIIVGGRGGVNTGGYGGGGSLVNIQSNSHGLGGGGRSAIQLNNMDIVTAGGGGGGNFANMHDSGGDGGVYIGRPGVLYSGYSASGNGGTQTSGGAAGTGLPNGPITFNGTSGSKYIGGDGVSTATTYFGGGGGGGWYGGGGGGGYYTYPSISDPIDGGRGGGGGGGSSYEPSCKCGCVPNVKSLFEMAALRAEHRKKQKMLQENIPTSES